MYYVFILECSDGSSYTEITTNFFGRLYAHQNGHMPGAYTFSRRPVQLIYVRVFRQLCKAIKNHEEINGKRKNGKKPKLPDLLQKPFPKFSKHRFTGYLPPQVAAFLRRQIRD